MISFKECDGLTVEEIYDKLVSELPEADGEYLHEILCSFFELCDECEDVSVAFSSFCGCLLVRIFDMGRYSFVYPISLSECADEISGVDAIRKYAIKEEIPLVITDVPREALGELSSSFRHVRLDAEDVNASSYRAVVYNELETIDGVPYFDDGGVCVGDFCDCDEREYARLCRDCTVNEYWGYDFCRDVGEVPDSYFLEEARLEFARKSAVVFAVRAEGVFAGEAVLYHFDFIGGAEVGFRLLPEFWGRGIGTRVLSLMRDAARSLGLVRMFAKVMKENSRSMKLLSKNAELVCERDEFVEFEINL